MIFGSGKQKQVSESEAEGEIDRVYHEIKQSLRVSGINLNFRTWAAFDKFLPYMWDAMRPLVETRWFEDAADTIRADAVNFAGALDRVDAGSQVTLGESQSYQIKAALDLYHYINPKLLVFTSIVNQALTTRIESHSTVSDNPIEFIERGIPAHMYPMEMVPGNPEDEDTRQLFDDIKQTLSLSSINSDYRTLALWPNYLQIAWRNLKPIIQIEEYKRSSDSLRENARAFTRSLPIPFSLSPEQIEKLGENPSEIIETTEKFERLLPSLIINIALLELDWSTSAEAAMSPFPAASRREAGS